MIEIVGSEGQSDGKILFTPRAGYKSQLKDLELDLIYGHVCPICKNVIQAFFYTPKEVKLWGYEATSVLSQGEKNMGEVLKVVPNEKSEEGDSCYKSYFYDTSKKAQKIVLKNHIIRPEAVQDVDTHGERSFLWETGERTCPTAGVFSMKEDIMIKDLCLIMRMTPAMIAQYNIPKVRELIPDSSGIPAHKNHLKWIPAVGEAPPIITLLRNDISQGFAHWVQEHLKPFEKVKTKSK